MVTPLAPPPPPARAAHVAIQNPCCVLTLRRWSTQCLRQETKPRLLQTFLPHYIYLLFNYFSGQFKRLVGEGPSCIFWPLQSVVGRLSLRVQQLDVLCETKTKDNVFVQVGVAVQYKVVTESAYDAWYRLTSPTSQIEAYVYDVIRSTVPRLEIDEAFESKDDIAKAVFDQLQNVMKGEFFRPSSHGQFSYFFVSPHCCLPTPFPVPERLWLQYREYPCHGPGPRFKGEGIDERN